MPPKPETIKEVFARRLRTFRERLGLTQPELARRVGVSRNTLINWEKPDDHKLPNARELEAICQAGALRERPAHFFTP